MPAARMTAAVPGFVMVLELASLSASRLGIVARKRGDNATAPSATPNQELFPDISTTNNISKALPDT
jgi:hypothetical protein